MRRSCQIPTCLRSSRSSRAALDELAEVCSPVDGGVALVTAGMSEIGSWRGPARGPDRLPRRHGRHHDRPRRPRGARRPPCTRRRPRCRSKQALHQPARPNGASAPGPEPPAAGRRPRAPARQTQGLGSGCGRLARPTARSSSSPRQLEAARRAAAKAADDGRPPAGSPDGGAVPMSGDVVLGLYLVRPGAGQLIWLADGCARAAGGRADQRGPGPRRATTFKPAPMWPSDRPQPAGGPWMGALVPPENADQVRLRVAIGDSSRTVLCHRDRPVPEPEAQPPAKLLALPGKPRRRTRRAAPELRS